MLNSYFEEQKINFCGAKKRMVGVLRKALQLLKLVRGPALKILVPVLDAVVPGLGSMANVVGNEGIDRVSDVYDAYEEAKGSGKNFSFGDGLNLLVNPPKKKRKMLLSESASEPGAVISKSADYGGLHPRLHLKEDGDDNY
jgi:hypothetical protein